MHNVDVVVQTFNINIAAVKLREFSVCFKLRQKNQKVSYDSSYRIL